MVLAGGIFMFAWLKSLFLSNKHGVEGSDAVMSDDLMSNKALIMSVKNRLDNLHVPPWQYNITGKYRSDNQYVVEKMNGKWCVYYYERGQITQKSEFDDRRSAYEDLVRRFV
jgi:ribonuclease HI